VICRFTSEARVDLDVAAKFSQRDRIRFYLRCDDLMEPEQKLRFDDESATI
jgi:hypothetical protein